MKLFTQETDVSQYLKEEALIVADYDYEKVTDFAVLGLKLRLKEGDDYEKITLKLIYLKVQNSWKTSPFGHNFKCKIARQ